MGESSTPKPTTDDARTESPWPPQREETVAIGVTQCPDHHGQCPVEEHPRHPRVARNPRARGSDASFVRNRIIHFFHCCYTEGKEPYDEGIAALLERSYGYEQSSQEGRHQHRVGRHARPRRRRPEGGPAHPVRRHGDFLKIPVPMLA
jgi:hypothetical protein